MSKICLICGGTEFKILDYVNIAYEYLNKTKEHIFLNKKICVCLNCGIGEIVPKINNDLLNKFYEQDYLSKRGIHYLAPQQRKKIKPILNYRNLFQFLLADKYIDLNSIKTFLDIGAGEGGSFYTLRKLGLKTDLYALEKWVDAINSYVYKDITLLSEYSDKLKLEDKYNRPLAQPNLKVRNCIYPQLN